jgi:hypothetical protein
MFKITEERLVEWPVKVRVAEAGKSRLQTFHMTFDVPDIDEMLGELGGKDLMAAGADDLAKVREFLASRVKGWRDVVDANDQALPFGPEVLAAALNRLDVLNAVITAFAEVMRGGQAKN